MPVLAIEAENPLIVSKFLVDVQGKINGYFTEINGASRKIESTEHKVMGQGGKQSTMKVPGRSTWEPIKLKRAITSDMELWAWRVEIENGGVNSARRNGTVTALDQSEQPVAEWTFDKGWPSKLEGPTMKADASEAAMEEITIELEGFRRTM